MENVPFYELFCNISEEGLEGIGERKKYTYMA